MIGNAAFLGRPVRSLQEMLRALSAVHGDIPALVPTGRFGPYTLEAVMVFQREARLPVTGRVDLATWNALAGEYVQVSRRLPPTETGTLFPCEGAEILPGQTTPLLYPIQGMFCGLSGVLSDFVHSPPTGKCDERTVRNTRTLQRCGGLEETGRFDWEAWQSLSRLYETFVVPAAFGKR